jgi:hypothetical protein
LNRTVLLAGDCRRAIADRVTVIRQSTVIQ